MKQDITTTFELHYEKELDGIFRFCLVRVSNREQALDLVQETFLRLWQNLQDGKEIQNCRAFLYKVAHNLIIDWYRKKKSISLETLMHGHKAREYDIRDETLLGLPSVGAEGKELLEKINELPDAYRDTLYLRFVEDLSPQEIGEVLGISANTASVRVNRGLIELRKKVGYQIDKN